MMDARLLVAVLLLAGLVGTSGAGHFQSARGQEAAARDTTAQAEPRGPTPHGRWGVGGQLFPVVGAGLRAALSRRVSVQVAGTPIPGQESADVNFLGFVGGRGLYKFVAHERYNVFGSAALTATFVEVLKVKEGDGLQLRRVWEGAVGWTGVLTVGAEAFLWPQVGVSAEVGVAEDWGNEDFRVPRVVGGVGLHYYW